MKTLYYPFFQNITVKFRAVTIVIAGSIISSGINFLLNISYARGLSVEDFGSLKTLLSFFGLISIPFGSIASVTTKYIADYTSRGKNEVAARLYITSVQFSLLIGAISFLCILFYKPVKTFLGITDPFLLGMVGVYITIATVNEVARGVVRGWMNFNLLGLIMVLEALLKLIGVLLLSLFIWNLTTIFSSIVISAAICLVITINFLSQKIHPSKSEQPEYKKILLYFVPTFLLAVHSAITGNIDILIVNSKFIGTDVGIYSTSVNLANLQLIPISAIGLVAFPKIASSFTNNENTQKVLGWYLGLASVVGIIVVGIYYLLPGFIVSITYGARYNATAALLPLLSIGKLFDGLTGLLLTHEMAIEKYTFFLLIPVIDILRISLLYFFPVRIQEIPLFFSLSSFLSFSILFLIVFFLKARKIS